MQQHDVGVRRHAEGALPEHDALTEHRADRRPGRATVGVATARVGDAVDRGAIRAFCSLRPACPWVRLIRDDGESPDLSGVAEASAPRDRALSGPCGRHPARAFCGTSVASTASARSRSSRCSCTTTTSSAGPSPGWLPGGFLGVEVFFVVSGYLITSLLLAERRETGTSRCRRFWIRRARRLLPALFVMLAVVVAYSLVFLPDTIAHAEERRRSPRSPTRATGGRSSRTGRTS